MNIPLELEQAKIAIQEKDNSKARSILRKVLEQEPRNVDAWLLFADAAQKPEHTIQCLERVLLLDSTNVTASERLEQLRSVPPVDLHFDQKDTIKEPINITTASSTPQPIIPEQPRTPTSASIHASTKHKVAFSNLEKLLITMVGLLIMCVLCMLVYSAIRGPLMNFTNNQPSSTPMDFTAVIYENIRASNAEDKQAYMATIHPDSPAYKTTEETLDSIFDNYDLSYRVSNLSVIEENNREVKITFTLVTRKLRGPDFRDNQVDGIIILRKDGDVWKIYNQTVENVKYLD